MKNKIVLKKTIIFFIILLIITAIAIVITINKVNKNNQSFPSNERGYNSMDEYGINFTGGIGYQAYFDVKSCMQKYLNSMTINSPINLLNLLSNKYIKENNITSENVYDNVELFHNQTIYIPLETKMIQSGDIKSFLTYGLVEDIDDYSIIDKIFAIVNIDWEENMFSIEPIHGEYNNIDEINIEELESTVIENGDNQWLLSYVEADDVPEEYIRIFKGLAFGLPERLYELLDEEYRNAKYGNIENFKKYIQENKGEITYASLYEFQTSSTDNGFRYVCIDNFGRYYVIKEKAVLQDYTIMLDTYTVDLPEFIEKYDNAEEHKKVALNIQKLITATKNKDYEYVYNKLDDTFKASNFPSLEDFKKYIKEKYDSDDRITFDLYKKAANIHLYDIKVINTGTNKNISARVAMDLKNNRDFKFSFSVNN